MPEDTYTLTKDKAALCQIIDRHVEREEAGEGDARDAEEAHPRGGRRLRGDVVRDDLG